MREPRAALVVALMDEHREEREELAAIQREDRDDARQTRQEWADEHELSLAQFVIFESEAWSR